MTQTVERKPWDQRAYMHMVAVGYRAGTLRVQFEDGDEPCLTVDRLLPSGVAQADWDRMTWNSHEIVVPTDEGDDRGEVIPWSTVRVFSDAAYSAHLADAARREARTLGRRLAALRRARGPTGKAVAERAGIAPRSLSRIERGEHDVVFSTLTPLLAAMGCSVRDLEPHRPLATATKRMARVATTEPA